MIRLIDLLKEDVNSIYYHVAPDRVYDSIKKYGLDPKHAPYERSTEGVELYVFKTLESAKWYKNYMENEPPIEPMNIWKIDASGLRIEKDYTLSSDSEEEDDAYIIKQPVPPNRLKFIEQ